MTYLPRCLVVTMRRVEVRTDVPPPARIHTPWSGLFLSRVSPVPSFQSGTYTYPYVCVVYTVVGPRVSHPWARTGLHHSLPIMRLPARVRDTPTTDGARRAQDPAPRG